MNLGTKATALLTAIVSTVLISSSYLLLQYQEESLKQTILEGLDGQAITTAYGIESFINEGIKDSHRIASALPVEILRRDSTFEIVTYLKKLYETFPKFGNGIFILDKDGVFLADYPYHSELLGHSFAFREYYQRTIKEDRGVVSKSYTSTRTNLPVLTLTVPVRDVNGKLIAIVACSIDLISQDALGAYRKQKFGKTGYLYVFDKSRQLVLHPDDKRLMTSVEIGKNRIMEAALKGYEGGGETINSLGVPMLLAVRPVLNTDWIVAVQVPLEEAYAPVKEARTRILFVSGVAILLAIMISAIAIRRVTRPLRQLERVSSQITGDLEQPENKRVSKLADSSIDILKTIHSHDEIGLLATSFLHLTTALYSALDSLQLAAEDWQRTFNSVHEAIVTLDIEERVVSLNQTAEDWFRISFRKAQKQNAVNMIFGVAPIPEDWPDITSLRKHQKVKWSQELELPSGIFEFTLTPITTDEATIGAVLIISDITERVHSDTYIRNMAFYDQLTGLPNRFLLHDRILQTLSAARRAQNKVGVMFLDLDRFKEVNDLHGHDVGDGLLCEVANRISGCIRSNDTLSRIGGDEFVVVLLETGDRQSKAAAVAERIIASLTSSLTIKGHELKITTSIGIAIFPDDGEDIETLLKHADMAMYRVKSSGRNNYQIFQG